MFSRELKETIDEKFNEILPFLKDKKEDVLSDLLKCNEEQSLLMKFLYGSMPLNDIGDYDFQLFLSFVDHALFLRRNVKWCSELPEDMFLDYVLYYRINDEDIFECRKMFYRLIYPRIDGMTIDKAVLEVNYWCLEHATYESQDDRTASPAAVFKSGTGRCGEESTFTVTALRSVGIPARQVYAPYWSHCDDNHAWVEVWCNGKWNFLGACEPEPLLNRGWFSKASSRAMLVHSRNFSSLKKEKIISKEGAITYINNTDHYAITKNVVITVLYKDNRPANNAFIYFEVLNMSKFSPIALLSSDENGQTVIDLGLGDIHINVKKDDLFAEAVINILDKREITLVLKKRNKKTGSWIEFNMAAPKSNSMNELSLTEEQREERERRIEIADSKRNKKIDDYYREYRTNSNDYIEGLFNLAKGNLDQILKFLEKDNNILREKMLRTLSKKDFRDVKAEVLEEHLNYSIEYKDDFDEEIFLKYILSPRIYFEKLTKFREFILNYFDDVTKKKFKKNPIEIWDYIKNNISYSKERDYIKLYSSPVGVLKIKESNPMSMKILFISICRTLGIPAKINEIDFEAEYYFKGQFISADYPKVFQTEGQAVFALKIGDRVQTIDNCPHEGQAIAAPKADNKVQTIDNCPQRFTLILNSGGCDWVYFQNWSIGVFKNGIYESLNLSNLKWDRGRLNIDLKPGEYRIITSNRIPRGDILAYEYYFSAEAKDVKNITLKLRDAKLIDMIQSIPIDEFKVVDDNRFVSAGSIAKDKNIFAWLEVGKEPTEHLLNEMINSYQTLCGLNCQVIFILNNREDLKNITLRKLLSLVPDIKIYYDNSKENINTIGRQMFLDPNSLPLTVLTDKGLVGLYGFSGYNVGIVDLLIKIIKTNF